MKLRQFLNPVIYVKLQPDLLTVREVNSGYEISEAPVMAVSRLPQVNVLAYGNAAYSVANSHAAELINPFDHPRTLISNFTDAELVMNHFVRKVIKEGRGSILKLSPIVVLQPMVDPEGGFTQIEIRALQELVLGVGARKAIIWQGHELSTDELKNMQFGPDGDVLN